MVQTDTPVVARAFKPFNLIGEGLRALPENPDPKKLEADGKIKHDPTSDEDFKSSGIWSLFGVYAIMVFFAIDGHGIPRLWTLLQGFFTADMDSIRSVGDTLTSLLPTVAALLVIEIPLMAIIGLGIKAMYGDSKSHGLMKAFSGIKRHYAMMTLTVIAEELFARGLFLGLPLWLTDGQLPTFAIYVLFAVGNGIWAAIHLGNFKDKSERKLGKVLPQFVGGITLTAVFLNFGLVGSIIAHLAFNNLLMTVHRKGTFNLDEIAVIIWRGMLLIGSLCALWFGYGKSLFDLSYWFYGQDFMVPGWQWQHYLLAVIAITSALTILGDLLLLDVLPEDFKPVEHIGNTVIMMALTFGIFFALGLLGVEVDIQVLIMALVFLLIRRSGSASGMTRVFWIGLPSLMALLCAILALGSQSNAWLVVLIVAAVELPDQYFRYLNADNDGFPITKR